MVEVKLPPNFDYSLAQLNNRKSVADWVKLGVFNIDDSALPALEGSAIVLPQGYQGPAFMVFSNFDVIMDWNRSVNYALSVAHLANQFVGDKPILAGLEAESEALTFKMEAAIRQYQATKNLPQDGYASPSLYQQLLQP
jgi:hypothetical protein